MAFIRDILDLDVVDAQILEGTQLHKKDSDEDELFSASMDVRAKLNNGTEVIIEIQVRKQPYFFQSFSLLFGQPDDGKCATITPIRHTHKMYEPMEPVYGIAILEKTLLSDEESPIFNIPNFIILYF